MLSEIRAVAYLAWVVAMTASVGSLFFSEVWKLPPCVLCWYQRVLMYPLVFIIAVGILRKDRNLPFYVLPLSTLGMGVAFLHGLLYYNIIPEAAVPCQLGISCTTRFFEWFGFITIPLMSLVGFTVISGCMVLLLKRWKNG